MATFSFGDRRSIEDFFPQFYERGNILDRRSMTISTFEKCDCRMMREIRGFEMVLTTLDHIAIYFHSDNEKLPSIAINPRRYFNFIRKSAYIGTRSSVEMKEKKRMVRSTINSYFRVDLIYDLYLEKPSNHLRVLKSN